MFEKVQDVIKFEKFKKVQNPHSITLSKDTQYCQQCNNVKWHAVQGTSTRFLTIAHFSNKGYTSIHKSLQKFEIIKYLQLSTDLFTFRV